jgi:hypothetical protein
VKNLHAVWIKIDETLPWIELEGTYETRKDAKKAANSRLYRARVKIVTLTKESKQLKAAVAMIRQ